MGPISVHWKSIRQRLLIPTHPSFGYDNNWDFSANPQKPAIPDRTVGVGKNPLGFCLGAV